MTIGTTDTFVVHRGNSSATVFPYTFRIPDPAYAHVYLRSYATHEVTEELTLGDFTITGATWTNYDGGNVTYNPGTPLSSDYEIVIERSVEFLQGLDLTNQGGFYAESVEQAFDLEVMQVLQVKEIVDRSLIVPIGETPPKFPGAALRPSNSILGTTEAGTDLVFYEVSASQLQALADAASEIIIVANHSNELEVIYADLIGDNTIGVVFANITEVVAVGNNISAVLAVNANEANINIVASNLNGADDIGEVASQIDKVVLVADNMAAVLAVNDNSANINIVAADLDGDNTIGVVSADISKVVLVADNMAAITALYTDLQLGPGVSLLMTAGANATLARLYAISDTDAPIAGAVSSSDRGAKYYADMAGENAAIVGDLLATQAAQMLALQTIVATYHPF